MKEIDGKGKLFCSSYHTAQENCAFRGCGKTLEAKILLWEIGALSCCQPMMDGITVSAIMMSMCGHGCALWDVVGLGGEGCICLKRSVLHRNPPEKIRCLPLLASSLQYPIRQGEVPTLLRTPPQWLNPGSPPPAHLCCPTFSHCPLSAFA